MNGAQIAMCIIYGMNIGIGMVKHGEPKTDKYSFWTSLLSVGISIAILKWGGFW